jgi:hypothetical protein
VTWYAQRDGGGKITGLFRCRQPQPNGSDLTDGIELADNDPQVVAFLNPPAPTANDKEAWARAALDASSAGSFDSMKLIKAKTISDLAFRLGKAPGALTAAEIQAERDRIAAIYKAL